METQDKGNPILRSVFTGIGIAILYLLIGTVLDYAVTQILSQFFFPNCSEDCYFHVFNIIFVVVAFLSFAGGIRRSIQTYKRDTEKS